MDDIREVTLQSRALTTPEGSQPRRQQLCELAGALAGEGNELRLLAGVVLERTLSLLDFERGFFLLAERDTSSGLSAASGFNILVSRCRRGEAAKSNWQSVTNPSFAVNHSVVARALASPEAVSINDCLALPGGVEEKDKGRAVVCQSFSLGPDARGAVYIDRGLGMPELGERERNLISEFLHLCLPALGRAYLAAEVERLRDALEVSVGPASDEEDDAAPAEVGAEDEAPTADYYGIIGRDEKLEEIFGIVEKVKDTNFNICVFGESGTGKELVARAIHLASSRREKEFVSENCGAIAENLLESELFGHVKGAFTGADEDHDGLFKQADGGTLFLDEIGDMSESMQRKLLRALQEGTIRPIGGKKKLHLDVRVVCASNRDLKHLVREGRFRADLYYRLNVIQVKVPPLRERRDDIPLLLSHFARTMAEEEGIRKRFSESALGAFLNYGWPGNVRELRNVVRRVLLTCPRRVIARKDVLPYLSTVQSAVCLGENLERDEDHLVLRIPLKQTFNDIIDECERLVLTNALKENGWNKSRVTKALRIPRQSLYNKISKYSLQRDWKEPGPNRDR